MCVSSVIAMFVVAKRRSWRKLVFFVPHVGQILSEGRGEMDIRGDDAAVATVVGGGSGYHVRGSL